MPSLGGELVEACLPGPLLQQLHVTLSTTEKKRQTKKGGWGRGGGGMTNTTHGKKALTVDKGKDVLLQSGTEWGMNE